MISAVWAFIGSSLRESRRKVARNMPWVTAGRGGNRPCAMAMAGGEAQLRTMQEKREEEKHGKQPLPQSAHAIKLPRQHGDHNTEERIVSRRLKFGHRRCYRSPDCW